MTSDFYFVSVTTEFPSILFTTDRTEEANSPLLTDDVPTVGEHSNAGRSDVACSEKR